MPAHSWATSCASLLAAAGIDAVGTTRVIRRFRTAGIARWGMARGAAEQRGGPSDRFEPPEEADRFLGPHFVDAFALGAPLPVAELKDRGRVAVAE